MEPLIPKDWEPISDALIEIVRSEAQRLARGELDQWLSQFQHFDSGSGPSPRPPDQHGSWIIAALAVCTLAAECIVSMTTRTTLAVVSALMPFLLTCAFLFPQRFMTRPASSSQTGRCEKVEKAKVAQGAPVRPDDFEGTDGTPPQESVVDNPTGSGAT